MTPAHRIPGLPPALVDVPHWRADPETGDEDASWRADWLAWRNNVLDYRHELNRRCAADPHARELVKALVVREPKYFLTMFCWFWEPRETPLGPPDWYPWILLPPQVQMIDQLMEMWAAPKGFGSSGAWEKSRDMAATATVCGLIAHHFMYRRNFTAGLVSFREAAVDNGTPGCMFFKVRATMGIERGAPPLPSFLRVPGFDPANKDHNGQMRIKHPEWTNTISGEPTTTRAGRGDRQFARLDDEAAQFDGLNEVRTALGAVTDHLLDLSSAHTGYGPDFRDLCQLAKQGEERRRAALLNGDPLPRHTRYLRLDPWLHPFHDEGWFETERTTTYEHDPEGFAREVMIDYRAGSGAYVYEEAEHVQVAPGRGPLDVHGSSTYTSLSFDVGGTDQTAIVVAQRDATDPAKRVLIADCYRRSKMPAKWYAHVVAGVPPEAGDDMYDRWRREATPEDERFLAFCATLPWDQRVRFFGDPAGAAKEVVSRQSFYDVVEREATALRKRKDPSRHAPLRVMRSWDKRDHQTRRFAGREVLTRTDCADTDGARHWLYCVRNYRFQEIPDKGRVGAPTPIHDKKGESDVVTAWEFFCVHEAAGIVGRAKKRGTRQDLAGRKVA